MIFWKLSNSSLLILEATSKKHATNEKAFNKRSIEMDIFQKTYGICRIQKMVYKEDKIFKNASKSEEDMTTMNFVYTTIIFDDQLKNI